MRYLIPAEPDYLSFIKNAESIDDFQYWLGNATIKGIYEYGVSEGEVLSLTDTDNVRIIAPNLAAKGTDGKFKFLFTSDRKFLTHQG